MTGSSQRFTTVTSMGTREPSAWIINRSMVARAAGARSATKRSAIGRSSGSMKSAMWRPTQLPGWWPSRRVTAPFTARTAPSASMMAISPPDSCAAAAASAASPPESSSCLRSVMSRAAMMKPPIAASATRSMPRTSQYRHPPSPVRSRTSASLPTSISCRLPSAANAKARSSGWTASRIERPTSAESWRPSERSHASFA